MKTLCIAVLGIVLLACSLKLFARRQSSATVHNSAQAKGNNHNAVEEGERRFQANCGRCHNPPDSLSPREVKAVLQHMRVRAMLTAEDEQLILKYLAP